MQDILCTFQSAPFVQLRAISSSVSFEEVLPFCSQVRSRGAALSRKSIFLHSTSFLSRRPCLPSFRRGSSLQQQCTESAPLLVVASGAPEGTTRRLSRLAELIRREIGRMLMEAEVKDARLMDPGVISVTHVEIAGDLAQAKVYVSVYGEDEKRKTVMEGLKSASGFIRKQLGTKLMTRLTPKLFFIDDRSFEIGQNVFNIMRKLEQDKEERAKRRAAQGLDADSYESLDAINERPGDAKDDFSMLDIPSADSR